MDDIVPSADDAGLLDSLTAWLAVQGVNILIGLAFVLIGWRLAALLSRWLVDYLERSDHMDPIVEKFLASLLYYGLLALVVIIALSIMGVQTTSLIAVLGAASLAVGLALQGSLSSLAAGVLIILLRPFKIGDYIDVAGKAGTVKSVSLFLTELATYDNIQVLLPNAEVWDSAITNYSVYPTRMLDIVVGIDYEDSIDEGLATLKGIAEQHGTVLSEPPPDAFVSEIGDSAITLTLRAWVPADDYWPMRRELSKLAKEKLEADGLSIPFPRREVIIRGAANDGAAAPAAAGSD